MKSYKIISSFNNGKRILRMDEALEFTNVLEQRLAVHGNVIDKLSDGFRYIFFSIYLFDKNGLTLHKCYFNHHKIKVCFTVES